MSLTTPSTQDINDNIIAQLEASLGQTIPIAPKAFLRVLAKVLAAVFIILYKYAGFTFLQIFVSTASGSDTEVNGVIVNPLTEWGRLVGVGDPTPAIAAELVVAISVESQVGTLPAGSQLVGVNNGIIYLTLADVLLDAAQVSADVLATTAGTAGNLIGFDIMTFANPLPNVARDATVVAQNTAGADGETTEAYRQRILDRFQKPPQGGAYADYQLWAVEVPDIINAYPYTGDPGEVDVYSESDGLPDGIPTAPQLQAVLDSIELDDAGLATRRPANAYVNSLAITRTGFDVTVVGITQVDDLAQVEADVTLAVANYFLAREPFIVGLSIPPRTDTITASEVNGVVNSVVSAAGGLFVSSSVFEGVSPVTTRPLAEGEKAKSLGVTYV